LAIDGRHCAGAARGAWQTVLWKKRERERESERERETE